MDYAALKLTHVSCAAVSYTLFVVRGIWMMRRPVLLQQRWLKIVPHVVDTVLLASAIVMVVISRQYPLVMRWVDAKLIALAIYIALGMIALKYGRTMRIRIGAWLAAQLVFVYIVTVALTRNPMPWTA